MKELINQILNFWSNYWGDSLFSYLLILAAAYLLIFKRKEENVKYVLTYLLIMLFLFFSSSYSCCHSEMHWCERLLASVMADSFFSCNCTGNDRIDKRPSEKHADAFGGIVYRNRCSEWKGSISGWKLYTCS